MMSKNMFQAALVDLLYEKLPDGFSLDLGERYKDNDLRVTSVTICKEGSNAGCVLYVENLYDRYVAGNSVEDIVSDVVSRVETEEVYSMNFDSFTRDDMLKHSTYRMANKFTNQMHLADVPCRDVPGMTDIVIYPVYEVHVGSNHGSILVKNSMLESNGISLQEIHAAAEANTERRVSIIPLDKRLEGMIGGMEFPAGFESPFLVSYDREAMGDEASVLGAPKVLASLKEPYYVIPSSTHELLFLPKSFESNVKNLQHLVSEVNSEVLDAKDVLSNNVYELNQGRFITHEAGASAVKQFVQE